MTARTDGPPGRLPDFFIAGQHKSGTTALYEMLRRHPQVYMPELKETKFFASDLPSRMEGDTPAGLPTTIEEYVALFAPARADQSVGEASPQYLRSERAAGAIASYRPDALIVGILREPASFVRSLHMQMVQSGVESELDLRKALENEAVTRAGGERLRYSDHVRYVEQLRRYERFFPREQLLVLIYDDYRADNAGTVREVLDFIGVDADVPLEAVETNRSVRTRNARMSRVVDSVAAGRGSVGGAVNRAIKAVAPRSLRRRALRTTHERLLYATPEAPDEELMLELRRRYEPEVHALGEYLDRDLVTLWGYDRLDG
ncbi:MAG TPA: sulfotransferase [Solirubrobacteraceae bacterium]|nr:sulfotransferase [Solirubrobacteraceae bacterium]